MTGHSAKTKRKNLPLWLVVILDAALIGATLLLYALFQHVLPMRASAQNAPSIGTVTVTPAPTAVPAEATPAEPPQEQALTWAERFASHFTAETVSTGNSYTSANVSLTVSEHREERGGSAQRWYMVDIYLTDIRCLQTYMPGGAYSGASAYMPQLSEEAGALAAINGDYASLAAGGVIIRNGVLCRSEWYDAQIGVLYENGVLACCDPQGFDAQQALADGAWQAWTFGPALLDADGRARSDFGNFAENVAAYGHPRTALGYFEPGHYCFVVVDGRQPPEANGLTMAELASLMEELGCAAAYNLDGGASAQMTFQGEFVNTPTEGGRYVNDIVLVKDIFAGEGEA